MMVLPFKCWFIFSVCSLVTVLAHPSDNDIISDPEKTMDDWMNLSKTVLKLTCDRYGLSDRGQDEILANRLYRFFNPHPALNALDDPIEVCDFTSTPATSTSSPAVDAPRGNTEAVETFTFRSPRLRSQSASTVGLSPKIKHSKAKDKTPVAPYRLRPVRPSNDEAEPTATSSVTSHTKQPAHAQSSAEGIIDVVERYLERRFPEGNEATSRTRHGHVIQPPRHSGPEIHPSGPQFDESRQNRPRRAAEPFRQEPGHGEGTVAGNNDVVGCTTNDVMGCTTKDGIFLPPLPRPVISNIRRDTATQHCY